MAIRDTLLANLTTSLSGSNVTISSELPFEAGGIRLYDKNMKKLYLSYDRTAMTEMFNTLSPATDVYQKEINNEAIKMIFFMIFFVLNYTLFHHKH